MTKESFSRRHIGPRESDVNEMLKTVKASSVENLIEETIPSNIRLKNGLDLESPLSESDYLMHLKDITFKQSIQNIYWFRLSQVLFTCCYSTKHS